jgi:hypothetical protein
MKKTWKQFNKLMKDGRIHRVIKAAGLKRKKKNGRNTNVSSNSGI